MNGGITIRIVGRDDCVTADTFLEAVEDVLAMLNGIAQEMLGQRDERQPWHLTHLGMQSPPEITMSGNADVIDRLLSGTTEIEQQAKRPRFFSDPTLLRGKRLVSLLNDGAAVIELKSDHLTVRPTQHLAANVDELIGEKPKPYEILMQMDGRLELLSVHGQTPAFNIYDPLSNEPVRCLFKPEAIDEVADLIKRKPRVRVTGMTKHNAKHKPVSVVVDSYEVLPEQLELPQIDDLHKAKINITGGMDSAKFIREQRDDDQD